jgi:hypothetical protein
MDGLLLSGKAACWVRRARAFRHEKECSAPAAGSLDAAGERGAGPLAQECRRGRARLARAAQRAKHDDTLGFALLHENSRRKAGAVFLDKRQSARRVAGLARCVRIAQKVGLGRYGPRPGTER